MKVHRVSDAELAAASQTFREKLQLVTVPEGIEEVAHAAGKKAVVLDGSAIFEYEYEGRSMLGGATVLADGTIEWDGAFDVDTRNADYAEMVRVVAEVTE